MSEITNYYTSGFSDQALTSRIGKYIKSQRLTENKTQEQVANEAGINRSTLIQLEQGKGATLQTLIQVLRVLKQLHVLDTFILKQEISPLLLADIEHSKRKRARNKGYSDTNQESDW